MKIATETKDNQNGTVFSVSIYLDKIEAEELLADLEALDKIKFNDKTITLPSATTLVLARRLKKLQSIIKE